MTQEFSWRQPPPPTTGQVVASWAHHSIRQRLPDIARRTLSDIKLAPHRRRAVESLAAEIPAGPIRQLESIGLEDETTWREYVEPYVGQNWLTPPWFFVETYFYRRMLVATGWNPARPQQTDPFRIQKQRGLEHGLAAMPFGPDLRSLADLLLSSLWGNQADLSLWPGGDEPGNEAPSPSGERLLMDNRADVVNLLATLPPNRQIDLVLDNAGAELLADLDLVQRLLTHGCRLWLHLKGHPTFVSDATLLDWQVTLQALTRSNDAGRSLAGSLVEAQRAGRLELASHTYWTSPLAGWELPSDLRTTLASSSLILVKGDANYRRLLGDRRWPPTQALAPALDYLPAPVALLRSLKCELAVGLSTDVIRRAEAADPAWMVNGRWGLIQFYAAGPGIGRIDGTSA